MSGPKTSKYRLTPAQRRALIARREIDRRTGEARANIIHLTAKLDSVAKLPESYAEQAEALKERTGSDGGYKKKLEKLEKITASALKKLSAIKKDEQPEKLEKAVTDARKTLDEAVKLRGELEAIAAINIDLLRLNITDSLNRMSGIDLSRIATPAQKQLREMKLEISGRLAGIPTAELSEPLRQEIYEAEKKLSEIDSEEFLRNFSSMTVSRLEKDCREYSALRREIGQEFDSLLASYQTLCEQAGTQPEEVPFDSSAVQKLKQLISVLEEEISHSDEQSYISRCIDDVMEEMGYRLIGNRSVVKKSGASFHNELYSFSEGTAVNVTYSSAGSITMELGGLDETDRLPDPAEADRLAEDMRIFCGRFKEFERRLLEKGVESEHISLLPPDAAYAQIINIADYDITGEVSISDLASQQSEEYSLKKMSEDE